MVGGRSRGCYLCKQRRIKCDGGRPACRRCAIHGKPCPGYPDTYVFREEKQNTKLILSRRQSQPAAPSLSTIRLPGADQQDQAVCFFVNEYRIAAESDGAVGFLDFLPDMMMRTNNIGGEKKDCLHFALHAVSNLVFFNRSGDKSLYVDARKSYGAALELVHTALRSGKEAASDQTFAAVLLLSLFIDIAGERDGLSNQHTAGIFYLMRLRGSRNVDSDSSSSLFSWGICFAMIQFLLTGEYQCAGLADLLTLAPESSHWHSAVRVCGKIAFFMSVTNPLVDPSAPVPEGLDASPDKLRGLFDFALDILEEIDNWHRTIPDSWKQPSSPKGTPSSSSSTDSFDEINPEGPWAPGYVAMFYCAEIFFYTRLHESMKSPILWMSLPAAIAAGDLLGTVASLPKRIGQLLSSLCLLVQQVFNQGQQRDADQKYEEEKVSVSGRVGGAYMFLGPLWLVSSCPFASPEQIKICRHALEYIGGKLGFKLALSLIEASSG